MTRTALGIAVICLFATSSFATGFEVPRLPDFSLQRSATPSHNVDRSMTTGSIKAANSTADRAPQQRLRHHSTTRKPMAVQQQ